MIATELLSEIAKTSSVDPSNESIENFQRVAAMAAVIDLIDRIAACRSISIACHQMASALRQYLECREVYIALPLDRNGRLRVIAVSGINHRPLDSEPCEIAEGASEEAALRQRPGVWPPDNQDRGGLSIHRRLCDAVQAVQIVSVPLIDDHNMIRGVWILVFDERNDSPEKQMFLRIASAPIASLLVVLSRAEPHWLASWTAAWFQPGTYRRWQIGLTSVALIMVVMLFPIEHITTCDCELQPVTRRFVAPQFDGKLHRTFVKPGDLVTRDQLLVSLDANELRLEQAGLEAERHRIAKKRDGEIVERNFGAASISKHELDRIITKLELIESRFRNLEIRSPIDGLVVSGDLQRAEGMPVTRGQSLFEIAPLDKMVAEIAIPEADIRHVRSGMTVDVSFESAINSSRSDTLGTIHPRAEIRNQHNVFIAQVELENEQQQLRPGMYGQARVHAGSCLLGWRLFHHLWERLTLLAGW